MKAGAWVVKENAIWILYSNPVNLILQCNQADLFIVRPGNFAIAGWGHL
jgi:hypothetical protein